MKKITLVLTMLLLALSFGVQAQNQTQNKEQKPKREELKIGSAMPEINLKSEVYGNITNKDLKGSSAYQYVCNLVRTLPERVG